jgi:hypothetical protein
MTKEMPNGSAEHDAIAVWLREQGLQLCVVITSAMAASCYLVGRAGLLGWYDAAGIPQLVFSWSIQDIVIRGLYDAQSWILVVAAGIVGALYLVVLDLISGRLSKAYVAWNKLRARGERLDRVSLRSRWSLKARHLRLSGDVAAEVASQRWRALGKRGLYRSRSLSTRSAKFSGTIAYSALAIVTLMFLGSLYVVGVILMFERPYKTAAESFQEQYLAATGHLAPSRRPMAWAQKRTWSKSELEEAEERGRAQLGRYPFVRLVTKEPLLDTENLCGWLIQAASGQILMLTAQGIVMRSFGDSHFSWRTEAPEACMAGSPGKLKS